MPALRWGIASCGRISGQFADCINCLSETGNHELVAVAARNEESAKSFAENFGARKFYGGYENLAKDPDVDIVYIGSINTTHYDIAKLMLDHGKPILCEKPLCMNEKQAKKLIDHAKSKKLFCMEAIWSRFFPAYTYLKELVGNGSLGEINEITVDFGILMESKDRISKKALGGGVILDIGIYAIQLVQWVLNQAPISIEASGTLNSDGVDIVVETTLNYPTCKAIIKLSARDEYSNIASIKGSKATLQLHKFHSPISITDINGQTKDFELPKFREGKFNYFKSVAFTYQAEAVRKCLEQGLLEHPSVTHAESLLIAKIEDEIRRQVGVKYPEDE